MYCGHGCEILWPPHSLANPLLICLLQTHQGENVEVQSHRGTASPLTTCCRAEEWPQVKQDCGMCLLLLVALYWIDVYTCWPQSKQNKWSPVEVSSARQVMLRCCHLWSLLQALEEQSQEASLLPAVWSRRFTARYWQFSLLSIISDSDHKTSWWEREDCNSI